MWLAGALPQVKNGRCAEPTAAGEAQTIKPGRYPLVQGRPSPDIRNNALRQLNEGLGLAWNAMHKVGA